LDVDRSSADATDAAYEIPFEKRWDDSMAALRASGLGLEMRPDDDAENYWSDFCFGSGVTILDLTAHDYEKRLDEKLGVKPVPDPSGDPPRAAP
jgi:hypothetical protein